MIVTFDVRVVDEHDNPVGGQEVTVRTSHLVVGLDLPHELDSADTDGDGYAEFEFEFESTTVMPDDVMVYVGSEEYGSYSLYPLDEHKVFTVTIW